MRMVFFKCALLTITSNLWWIEPLQCLRVLLVNCGNVAFHWWKYIVAGCNLLVPMWLSYHWNLMGSLWSDDEIELVKRKKRLTCKLKFDLCSIESSNCTRHDIPTHRHTSCYMVFLPSQTGYVSWSLLFWCYVTLTFCCKYWSCACA